METVRLVNGVELPKLGMGDLRIADADEFQTAFNSAVDQGFRLFDTAQSYGNEDLLGKAIKSNGIPRD